MLLAIAALATSFMLGLPRFLLYGVALFAGGVFVATTRLNPGVAFLIGGSAMLASGAFLLVRFLQRYPITTEVAE